MSDGATRRPRGCVFLGASLDGFVAREDGSLDFLAEPGGTDTDHGFRAFLDGVQAIVMGRVTYETVIGFHEWPYEGVRMIVPSHTLVPRTDAAPGDVEITTDGPEKLFDRLGADGVERVYVDGGRMVHAYLEAGLIHELTITRVPVLLGGGIPLFRPTDHERRLTHLETRAFPNGFVQSRYRIDAAHERSGEAVESAEGS